MSKKNRSFLANFTFNFHLDINNTCSSLIFEISSILELLSSAPYTLDSLTQLHNIIIKISSKQRFQTHDEWLNGRD